MSQYSLQRNYIPAVYHEMSSERMPHNVRRLTFGQVGFNFA